MDENVDDSFWSAEQERPISPDRILSAVANKRRRAILNSLNSAPDGTLEYDTLVDRVAERVADENTGGAPTNIDDASGSHFITIISRNWRTPG
jgi:hypothetical protein